MPANHLPPELWLYIFRWATYPVDHSADSGAYEPFHTSSSFTNNNLAVKWTLALVCRKWRALSTDFLYEYVRIGPNSDTLLHVLQTHGYSGPYGNLVHRVDLPYYSTQTQNPNPLPVLDILRLCPNLEVLTRQGLPTFLEFLRFEFEAGCLPLTSLRRLEWSHRSDAAMSGGINSLFHVLQCAPNLQYLSVGGILGLNFILTEAVHLPSLTTLRFRGVNGLFLRQMCRWSLPALTHIIADSPIGPGALDMAWEAFGGTLRTVELGKHLRFYLLDSITPCLDNCPDLQELNFYVHFTIPPLPTNEHFSLTTVGLHAAANDFLQDGDWAHIEEHFRLLAGPMFPSLEHVKLYGEWRAIVSDPRFERLCQSLRRRRCVLQLADSSEILTLALKAR